LVIAPDGELLPRNPALVPLKEPAREEEKNLCEPAAPLRIVDELGSRFEGLKLSRDGLTGILPVRALACRKDASLMAS
jgi:hypothetical protein